MSSKRSSTWRKMSVIKSCGVGRKQRQERRRRSVSPPESMHWSGLLERSWIKKHILLNPTNLTLLHNNALQFIVSFLRVPFLTSICRFTLRCPYYCHHYIIIIIIITHITPILHCSWSIDHRPSDRHGYRDITINLGKNHLNISYWTHIHIRHSLKSK